MSKYVPPVTQQSASAVAQQKEMEAGQDTSIGIPTPKQPTTPADIYKTRIDDLVKFLRHEIHSGLADVRGDYQAKVIDMFNLVVELDYDAFEQVMDHFIRTVSRNELAFADSELFAALYNVESKRKRPVDAIQRYKWFMTFFVGMARNIRARARYVSGHDIGKFLSKFPVKARENLNSYVYR